MPPISTHQKFALFINSFGTFLISFFSVKIAIILVKYIIAWFFGIETVLVSYRLMGISTADSAVWTVESIYAYYSAELIVSFIIFVIAGILFRVHTEIPTQRRIFYLWFGFSAMHSFSAAIAAGIITKTNVFHFLQWLYIPNHILMLIFFILLPLMIIFGWSFNKQFLIATPINVNCSLFKNQRIVLFYGMFLPVAAGILFFIIPVFFSLNKYEYYEFFVLLVMALPVLLYFHPSDYFKPSQNFSKIVRYKRLFVGLTGCVIFLIINLVKHILT